MSTTVPASRTGTTRRDTIGAMVLVLLSPVAWTASLALSYVVEDFVCSAVASAGAPAPAATIRVIILALNVVLLLATIAAGVLSARHLRRWRNTEGAGLESFLSAVGLALAVIFAFGIVLIASNPLVLEVCGWAA